MTESRHGRALADPMIEHTDAFYQQLLESLCSQHPDLCAKEIRISGYSVPLMTEWDMSVKPYRRWHGVDYEVRELA